MFKKILSKALTVLLVLLALLCGSVMVKRALGKEPTVFGCRFFYIVTGSMEPTIPVGAAVMVHQEPGNDYKVGDVITFKASQQAISGQPNTHRIVAKDTVNGTIVYTTKGDANNAIDAEPVFADNVYGKVIWTSGSMKWLGTFMGMVTTPMGFFACIILPILVIAGIMAKDFAREYKKAVEEDARQQMELQAAQQQAAAGTAAAGTASGETAAGETAAEETAGNETADSGQTEAQSAEREEK